MENSIWISEREKQVLQMLISEKKGHAIAKELGLDDKTVATYKVRLLKKTGTKTIIGLYLWNEVNKLVEIDKQEFSKNNVRTSKSRLNTKTMYYIRNTKTDQNFDPIENKFFGSNWEPQLEDDKAYLQNLIDNDKDKFSYCIIEEVTIQ